MASALVFGYLALALALGIWAGRRGSGGSDDFITGERSFGPVLMSTRWPTARSRWCRCSSSGPGCDGSARASG